MQSSSVFNRHALAGLCAIVMLGHATAASAADSYSGGVLTLSSLAIGNVNLSNVVIQPIVLSDVLSYTAGGTPSGTGDTYDPGTAQLTIPTIKVGNTTYTNVVVAIPGSSAVSIGAVSGADTYDGKNLRLASVETNGTLYRDVAIGVGLSQVSVTVAGGMPTAGSDTYNGLDNLLAIPAIQVGSRVYTNVVLNLYEAITLLAAPISVGGVTASAAETLVYSFTGNGAVTGSVDASSPGPLVFHNGIYYGTSASGGAYGNGTLFSITPGGVETVLYAFGGISGIKGKQDCGVPSGGLTLGTDGNFYGTASSGGTYGVGCVFKYTAGGTESPIYSFSGPLNGSGGVSGSPDASTPTSGLTLGKDGNFYGTTAYGGAYQSGAVYKITPAGAETVVYSFNGHVGTNPQGPRAGLILGRDGNFYGTSGSGGSAAGQTGQGTVFSITPQGGLTVLYTFAGNTPGSTDGAFPAAAVVEGTDGNFYGTTADGGVYNAGTIFKVTPAGKEVWTYSFNPQVPPSTFSDGQQPFATLIQASDGNFYGTTILGGAYGEGTVFRVTPTGVETTLYSFSGCATNGGGCGISGSTDSAKPQATLVQAGDGSLWGTASAGGTYQQGTVFSLRNVVGQ